MKKGVTAEKAPVAIGPYSQGVEKNGFLFISGQLPINPITGMIEEDTIVGQARQSLENVKVILGKAGYKIEDVIKTTCFLNEMSDFLKFNEVYSIYFKDAFPARSCLAVKELPKKALCEIEVIACKGE